MILKDIILCFKIISKGQLSVMTIVCIADCLLLMIFRDYISIFEVKEVIKFQHNPCKIGRAAVPLLMASSAAL